MYKAVIILGVLSAVFVYEASSQRFIHPTYRPPPKRPVTYRFRRDAGEPQWLYQGDDVQRAPATGDHIDDIQLDPHTRVARSLGTPRATGSGGSSSTRQSSSRDTGPTHPGYNRRNARSLPVMPIWPTLPPFNPQLPGPKYPWDSNPRRIPIYV